MRKPSVLGARVPFALICSMALALISFSGAAAAESADAASDQPVAAESTGVAEVIVTARRREERLEDVPVSVSVLSAAALQEQRILTETDLQAVTPGLTVRQTSSSNQTNFAIRGQSLDAFSFASPAVLPYFNEFNALGVSGTSFFDLDSIQVLKGPQGTLFGRNATGGAVLLQSHEPDLGRTGGYLRASIGNYDDRLFEGAFNLPIGDIAALRLSAQDEQRDGFQNNVLLNEKEASVDNMTVRAGLRLHLGDTFDDVLTAQYGRYRGNSAGTRLFSAYAAGQTRPGGILTLSPAIPAAVLYGSNPPVRDPRIGALGITGLFQFAQSLQTQDFYNIYNNQDARHRAQQHLVTNVTNWEVSDAG
jgi:iron complex outermembrane receptor protein